MKYYFILNPTAGSGIKGKEFLTRYEELKSKNEYDLNIYETVGVGDSTRFVAEICTKYPDEDICIFACGGDGTMNEVVTGVANYSNAILGIVPTGSCNDFLKSFNEYDFMDLEKQVNGTIINCDLLKVDEFYSLNVTNIGFDAKVNYDQIRLRPKYHNVKKAYNKAIINNILKPLGDKVKVTIDGEVVFDGKALLMAFGNGNFYGGGYNCTPCADVSDGLIDYQIVKKVSVLTFATLIGKFKRGLIFGNPKYKRIAKSGKAKKIVVESPKTLTICIDGETIHRNKVTIEILKHKIRFILPKK